MKNKIKLSRDGKHIQIFIPIKLQRKSGRKTIISPQGQVINPDRNPEQDEALLTALVRAHRWNRLLVKGDVGSVKEIAENENISGKSYVSRILRLTFLAPDIQEAILNAQHPPLLTLADMMRPFPDLWEDQRGQFGFH